MKQNELIKSSDTSYRKEQPIVEMLQREKSECAKKLFQITTITLVMARTMGYTIKIKLWVLERWLSQKLQMEQVVKFTPKAALWVLPSPSYCHPCHAVFSFRCIKQLTVVWSGDLPFCDYLNSCGYFRLETIYQYQSIIIW